ncbi:MAG: polymerase sigma factor, sigma-70 family [Planctomycetaceae bacterium]|nr:polymerase sigma factor, sigma-70 family [Planctomycetaceae bacterium]
MTGLFGGPISEGLEWPRLPSGWRWLGDALLVANAAAGDTPVRPVVSTVDWSDIQNTLNGDGDAFGRLVQRYQTQIGQWLWRFSRDRTVWEELSQTVFVEAYLHLGKFRGTAPFLNWLRKIATRVGYRHWQAAARQRRRGQVPLLDDPAMPAKGDSQGAENQAELNDEATILHQLLDELPPRDRLVITLLHIEERSVAETAELIGWSQVMVKVQAFRARKKLRVLWDRRVT